MTIKAYVAARLSDKDQAIVDSLNEVIEQVKVAPLATEEIIKELDAAGALDKEAISRLTSYTIQDVTLATKLIGRTATLEDVTAARAEIASQAVETLVRDAVTRRINQLWANIDKCQTDEDVIAEFSK